MNKEQKCRAKNPATCRVHGTAQTPVPSVIGVDATLPKKVEHQEEGKTAETILQEGSVQYRMFELFKNVNELAKEELCEKDTTVNVDDTSDLTTGYSFKCEKCGKTHFFTGQNYDKTVGGKVMAYLFRQLPDKYRNNQYLGPMMGLQLSAMDSSFDHHYKTEGHKSVTVGKLRKQLRFVSSTKVFDDINVPEDYKNQDWSTSVFKIKEGLDYIEPSEVPKEILYKFSQCLRKKQHESAEAAQQSLVSHKQDDIKEVYACPHCKKYHYGTRLDPNRTEEERYEFAKKTWALPDYREAVSLVIQSYGLKK